MAERLLGIKITGATLFLYEHELMNGLPRDLLKAALQRGKAILRSRLHKDRVEKMREGGDKGDH